MELTLEHLSIGYKHQKAVAEDINLTFHGAELACLTGANGIGKSTLLKTVSGYLPPKGGSVMFDGKDISSMTHDELSRTVSIVLASAPIVDNLSVRELAALGRTPYTGFWGRLSDADWRIVDDALSTVGIENLAGRMTQTLSDGERQKAMIARALAQQTPVMLLDEPTAFLDYPSKVELMRLLQSLANKQQKTIIVSTHDLDLAVRLADRIYRMDDGKLRAASREEIKKMME